MEDLFRQFWWLIFPLFGMFMAVYGMITSEKRTRNVIDLIKSYTDQGKEPPAELLALASQQIKAESEEHQDKNGNAWSFVIFAAVCAGFSVGYYFVRDQDFAWAFLIVATIMGVLAIGALGIAVFGRK